MRASACGGAVESDWWGRVMRTTLPLSNGPARLKGTVVAMRAQFAEVSSWLFVTDSGRGAET